MLFKHYNAGTLPLTGSTTLTPAIPATSGWAPCLPLVPQQPQLHQQHHFGPISRSGGMDPSALTMCNTHAKSVL